MKKIEYLKKIPRIDNFTNTSLFLFLMFDPKLKTPLNFRQSIEIVREKSKFGRRIIFTKDSSSNFGFANFIFGGAPKTD